MTTLAQQFETLLRRRQELTASGLMVQPDVSIIARVAAKLPCLIAPAAYCASRHDYFRSARVRSRH